MWYSSFWWKGPKNRLNSTILVSKFVPLGPRGVSHLGPQAYRIHRKFAPFFAQIFAKIFVKCKNLHKKLQKHLLHAYLLAFICANICTNFGVSKIFAQIFAQSFAQIFRLKILAQIFAQLFAQIFGLKQICANIFCKYLNKIFGHLLKLPFPHPRFGHF